MKTHPAITMLQVWAFCIVAFLVLPFELVNRTLTSWGMLMLALFITAFCAGGVVRSLQERARGGTAAIKVDRYVGVDFRRADRVLAAVALLSIVLLVLQILQGNFLDLEEAWQTRSDRAIAVMTGSESESGLLFQISFLLYPAGFIILAREIVFRRTPNLIRLGLFGLAPIVLVSLVMGGRGPILYALVLVLVAFRVRGRLLATTRAPLLRRITPRGIFLAIAFGIVSLVALNYFVNVFVVRAEGAGGVDAMFAIAESNWGVTFSGRGANFLFSTIGSGNTYLVFVFSWYLIQGLVMSNILFTDYVGPPHYGVSGIELITAAMRRIDGESVQLMFADLLDLNTYGFFSSAFGSLFLDFRSFGFALSFIWGYLAALVFYKTRKAEDPRWFLIAPFMVIGIFFSLINTPLGFSNGATTHLWMIAVFLLARPRILSATASGLPGKFLGDQGEARA